MNFDLMVDLMETDPFNGNEKLKEEFIQHKKEKSMANKISHQDITAFTKLLVEIGGVLIVDDDYVIRLKEKDEPILLSEDGKESAMIKIYHNNRLPGDYYVLNLFKESQFLRPEQRWFFDNAALPTMTMTLVLIMRRLINLYLNKDENNDKLVQLSNIISISDKSAPTDKMKKEISSIDYKDILKLYYKQQMKTGEIQSALNDEEVKKKYKNISKKTWAFIDDIFNSLFNTTPDGLADLFKYVTITTAAPKCEGHIVLIYRFYKRLEEVCELLEIETTDIEEFADHARYIEQYQQLASWDDGIRSKPSKILSPTSETQVPAQHNSYPRKGSVPKLNDGIYPSYQDMYTTKPSYFEQGFGGGNPSQATSYGGNVNVGYRTGRVPKV